MINELQCASIESKLPTFFSKLEPFQLFSVHSRIESLTKMIARWMTWQDFLNFPLKRKVLFLLRRNPVQHMQYSEVNVYCIEMPT